MLKTENGVLYSIVVKIFGIESLYGDSNEVITRLFYGNVEQDRFFFSIFIIFYKRRMQYGGMVTS